MKILFIFNIKKKRFSWSKNLKWKKTLPFTYMQHVMPQSLILFAAFSRLETPNFGTFGGVAHPLRIICIIFYFCKMCIMHIFEI